MSPCGGGNADRSASCLSAGLTGEDEVRSGVQSLTADAGYDVGARLLSTPPTAMHF